MKQTPITLSLLAAFCVASLPTHAAPRGVAGKGKLIHRDRSANIAERIASKEEEILFKQDAHVWRKDPEALDHRPEDLRAYSNHSYRRIVRLLTLGGLEEADGTKFKSRHAEIVAAAKAANSDGLDASEKQSIRTQLNQLNDAINAAVTEVEKGKERTPIVNRAQHRFEERIEFGVKSGRLSTLEASSLRRKVAKLEALEERLKAGQKLSSNERERLMKEVVELQRDLTRALHN
ncbi:hypothetical protein JIN77_12970 [Verrucomicrobiaceae bacterium R5-34]|nr:hypothetical protein [Verrucomicrobiaceae bacterium R5-34]